MDNLVLKKLDVLAIWTVLDEILKRTKDGQIKANVNFKFAGALDKSILAHKVDAINEARNTKHIPGFDEYQQKRVELIRTHARKNESGEVETIVNPDGTQQFRIDDVEAFTRADAELLNLYPGLMDLVQKHNADVNELLNSNEEVEGLRKINLKDIPEEVDGIQMEVLLPLIEA